MRIMSAVTGTCIVAIGAFAAITGEFAVQAVWLVAITLAAVGMAGLLTTVNRGDVTP